MFSHQAKEAGQTRQSVPATPEPERFQREYVQILAAILGLGLILGSTLIVSNFLDAFRGPKEIAFQTEAILLAVVIVFAATTINGHWRALTAGLTRFEMLLPVVIVAWTLMTTAVSTNRVLSEKSVVTVISAAVIFLATRRLAPSLSLRALDLCLVMASINAIFVTMQENFGFNPFHFPPDAGHLRSTALIGNPNDVGSYLTGPLIASLVATLVVPGRRRILYGISMIVMGVGLVASGTRTAMLAVVCGALTLALLRPFRQAIAGVLILIVVIVVVMRPSTVTGKSMLKLVEAAHAQRYDILFSERLPPFLSAIDMIRSRPIWGLGPGTFKYHYMDARIALEKRYPPAWTRSWPVNFGETHNDHLQTAAETGLPGYVLFLFAVGFVGFRKPQEQGSEDTRRLVASTLRAPMAMTFFVLSLAQFPLQIAAPRLMFITLAALGLGWDRRRV